MHMFDPLCVSQVILPGVNPTTLNGIILYYRLMTKCRGLVDSTELSRMGLSHNASHYPLPIPIDGGSIATIAEALVQRIQWPKDMTLILPMTRHPNPKAAIGSKGTTSDGGIAAQC
jgi:hypothetical protein